MDKQLSPYEEKQYTYGRVWTALLLMMMLAVPLAICVYYNAWPPLTAVLKALLGVAPMYWLVGIIEVLTYVPMLGHRRNLSGLRDGQPDQPESALCPERHAGGQGQGWDGGGRGDLYHRHRVQLYCDGGGDRHRRVRLRLLEPVLESPVLKPAFDNILPSLFGALGVVFVSKNPKIAAAPMLFMVVLFLLVPSLSSSVSVLVPVGALIAIGAARLLYRKGMIGTEKESGNK